MVVCQSHSSSMKLSVCLFDRDIVSIPAYPASDTALNIIITGATRQQELFYPWFTYVVAITREWFPFLTNYVIQNTYNYIP